MDMVNRYKSVRLRRFEVFAVALRLLFSVAREAWRQTGSLFEAGAIAGRIWQEHIWRACRNSSDRGYSANFESFSHLGKIHWNPEIPGYPSRAFDRVLGQLVRSYREPHPDASVMVAIFAFTKQCKLGCEHCFEGDALNGAGELSLAEVKSILKSLVESGLGQIVLSGGEPLNRFNDLVCLIEYLKDEPVEVWVNTSGVSLSLDRAQKLREAGLAGITISLDDHRSEGHEKFRGQVGLFKKVELAFANAQNSGLLTKATLCPVAGYITRENLDCYQKLIAKWGGDFIQILEPRSVGRYVDLKVELSGDRQRVLERFFLDSCNSFKSREMFPIVTYPDFERRRHGCLGGKRFIYVNTDGLVSPCPFCQKEGRPIEAIDWSSPFSSSACSSEAASEQRFEVGT